MMRAVVIVASGLILYSEDVLMLLSEDPLVCHDSREADVVSGGGSRILRVSCMMRYVTFIECGVQLRPANRCGNGDQTCRARGTGTSGSDAADRPK